MTPLKHAQRCHLPHGAMLHRLQLRQCTSPLQVPQGFGGYPEQACASAAVSRMAPCCSTSSSASAPKQARLMQDTETSALPTELAFESGSQDYVTHYKQACATIAISRTAQCCSTSNSASLPKQPSATAAA